MNENLPPNQDIVILFHLIFLVVLFQARSGNFRKYDEKREMWWAKNSLNMMELLVEILSETNSPLSYND